MAISEKDLLFGPRNQIPGPELVQQIKGQGRAHEPHEFVGRADRWCEVCNKPDRHPNHETQPARRELALSERPLAWLVERHGELFKSFNEILWKPHPIALELRVELESIEDELIDREEMKELGWSRLSDAEREKVAAILQRGYGR